MPMPHFSIIILNRILFIFFFVAVNTLVSTSGHTKEQRETRVIEIVGTATSPGEDVAKARDQAISNGLVSAVGWVVAELLSDDSLVENFQKLNEIIYTNTDKFVLDYKVLTGSITGNTYRVMVQATVSIDMLKEQLISSEIITVKKSMPKILFLIAEQNIEDISSIYWWGKDSFPIKIASESVMTVKMISQGFSIIEPDDLKRSEAEINNPDLTNPEAIKLGSTFDADIVIVGKAIAKRVPNQMGQNIGTFRADVEARAIGINTRTQIASTFQTAVTMNSDKIEGGWNALSEAANLAGEDLATQIAIDWQKENHKNVRLDVIVAGTKNLANFVKFRKVLNDLAGVKGMQLKEMNADEATIVVDFQGNAKELAGALMLKTFDSFGINIYEILPNLLRIQLIPIYSEFNQPDKP
ncbi:MAG: hypothetical protein JW786_14730 [Desulfobacterales bacterium]|nr:hypothetical protein [Desulfobacterales bacterium]